MTPAASPNLASQSALAGQIHVSRGVPAGTIHLRWFGRKPGQTAFVFVVDTANGELLLSAQTSGQTVQIHAVAVNTAGESAPITAISVAVA